MKDVMDAKLSRRRFLKTAPPAAGMLAYAGQGPAPANPAPQTKRKSSDVTLSGTAYTPVPDYPIQPKRYSEVTVKDTFWKPLAIVCPAFPKWKILSFSIDAATILYASFT